MEMDWKNLGFEYLPTHAFILTEFKDGQWSEPAMQSKPSLNLHISATCLHYGQSCFEGLKAFRTRDGKAGLFRPDSAAKRLIGSAQRICMQAPPEELFIEVFIARFYIIYFIDLMLFTSKTLVRPSISINVHCYP